MPERFVIERGFLAWSGLNLLFGRDRLRQIRASSGSQIWGCWMGGSLLDKKTNGSERFEMGLREFVEIAEKREEPFSSVCARFGISRTTGYKWVKRFRIQGVEGLVEQSRRPKNSPRKTPEAVAKLVSELRRENPDWSGVKIRDELKLREVSPLPAPSTIDLILRRRRQQDLTRQVAMWGANADALRFEPNYRWAIRYGREIQLDDGELIRPMWVEDVATKFIIEATLMGRSEMDAVMRSMLQSSFKRYGLPWRIQFPAAREYTDLTVWLIRIGLAVDFSPESMPQENTELQQLASRLASLPSYQREILQERTLKADWLEPLHRGFGMTMSRARAILARVREQRNFGGKQEALQKRSPLALYRPSLREYAVEVPEIRYEAEAEVRLVSEKGIFTFRRRLIQVGRGFAGLLVELRPMAEADHYLVLLSMQVLGKVDLSMAEVDGTTSTPLQTV